MNHGYAHWYMLVVIIPDLCVEIWDLLHSSLTVQKLMLEAKCMVSVVSVTDIQNILISECCLTFPIKLSLYACALLRTLPTRAFVISWLY